jgi:hypothetical protein
LLNKQVFVNICRFMPGRRSDDGKMLFEGARYVRGKIDPAAAPKLGVAVGPTLGQNQDTTLMSEGGIILPVQPGDDFKTVDVIKFKTPDRADKTKTVQKQVCP